MHWITLAGPNDTSTPKQTSRINHCRSLPDAPIIACLYVPTPPTPTAPVTKTRTRQVPGEYSFKSAARLCTCSSHDKYTSVLPLLRQLHLKQGRLHPLTINTVAELLKVRAQNDPEISLRVTANPHAQPLQVAAHGPMRSNARRLLEGAPPGNGDPEQPKPRQWHLGGCLRRVGDTGSRENIDGNTTNNRIVVCARNHHQSPVGNRATGNSAPRSATLA